MSRLRRSLAAMSPAYGLLFGSPSFLFHGARIFIHFQSVRAMSIRWIDDNPATLNGVPVEAVFSDYSSHHTTAEKIIVLKGKHFFKRYKEEAQHLRGAPWNMVELGIFEGGSTLIFAEDFADVRIAAFDLRAENQTVSDHIERMGFGDRVRLHYQTSQSDETELRNGIRAMFGNEPLHLVLDDASHHYDHTLASFEILFPLLAPGGKYVIEDWGWAHWPSAHYDSGNWGGVALSSLVMQLVMAVASNPKLFTKLDVSPSMVIVTKGIQTDSERMSLGRAVKVAPRKWQPLHLP